jgi:3-deoxy-D-manno-octulosonate 8-phosphate phosphatase (KDO 8-P phosphatase)
MNYQTFDFQKIKVLFCDVDGVMTSGKTEYASDGTKAKSFNHRDGVGVGILANSGIQVIVLSQSNDEQIIRARCRDIGISSFFFGVVDKKETGKRVLFEKGMDLENAAYIGDDLPDVELMSACKISFCPSDAHPSARQAASHILLNRGGEGCLREVADLIMFTENGRPSQNFHGSRD